MTKNLLRKFRKKAAVAIIFPLLSSLISGSMAFPVHAEEADLKEQISSAVILLEDVLKEQYRKAEEEIEDLAAEKGYDLALTRETYRDLGNPYKDMDYVELIATYASVSDYCEEHGTDPVKGISETEFISFSVSEDSTTEKRPVKVREYEPSGEYFIEAGYRYSDRQESIGIYEDTGEHDISGNRLYVKTGQEIIDPEPEEKKYGIVTLKVMSPRNIIKAAGIDEEKIRDDIERRKDVMTKDVSNEELSSSVFLRFPDLSIDSYSWNSVFYDRIGYFSNGQTPSSNTLVLAAAESLLGMVPYQWGGKPAKAGYDNSWWTFDIRKGGQKGLDCSGFVKWAYMTAGYGSDVTGQMSSTNTILDSDFERENEWELIPGDIGVVKRTGTNHCGIYAGNGQWYHCSSTGDTVVKGNYSFTEFFRPGIKSVEMPETLPITGIAAAKPESAAPNVITMTPIAITQEPAAQPAAPTNGTYDEAEVMTLAKIMSHEADSEGLNGWIAVGEVVMNRVRSSLFPNTISGVVYQKGQFTSVGKLAKITPRAEIIQTARAVINGSMKVIGNNGVMYFRNPTITSGISAASPVNWGSHKYFKAVGHHAFYLQ